MRGSLREGSMRASGEQVSVSLQLLGTAAGARLWADQFDLPRADLARLARTVATRIQSPLGVELISAESSRSMAERPDNPDARDLMLRGRAITNRPPSPENFDEARRLFERAVTLDEGSAQAHAL